MAKKKSPLVLPSIEKIFEKLLLKNKITFLEQLLVSIELRIRKNTDLPEDIEEIQKKVSHEYDELQKRYLFQIEQLRNIAALPKNPPFYFALENIPTTPFDLSERLPPSMRAIFYCDEGELPILEVNKILDDSSGTASGSFFKSSFDKDDNPYAGGLTNININILDKTKWYRPDLDDVRWSFHDIEFILPTVSCDGLLHWHTYASYISTELEHSAERWGFKFGLGSVSIMEDNIPIGYTELSINLVDARHTDDNPLAGIASIGPRYLVSGSFNVTSGRFYRIVFSAYLNILARNGRVITTGQILFEPDDFPTGLGYYIMRG